jgi:hypothetical protein
MALIEVKPGAKSGAFIGEDGAYPATLVAVEGPRTITPKDGREPFELMEWTFAVEGAPDDACLVWASTSTSSGPRSRMYGYLTALLGGKAPAIGQVFDAQDLVGRMAMITIRRDEEGWTKVDNVGALPRQPQAATPVASPSAQAVARPAPAAAADAGPAPQSLREQVLQPAAGDDALPF